VTLPRPEQVVLRGVLLVVALLLLWQLRQVVLLAFGGILFAVALRGLGDVIRRVVAVPERLSVLLALVVILAVVALGVIIFGTRMGGEIADVARRLPAAVERLADSFSVDAGTLVDEVRTQLGSMASSLVSGAASLVTATLAGLGAVLLVVMTGTFMAFTPQEYRGGFMHFVPEGERRRIRQFLDESKRGLRYWLLAQLLSMLSVGVLTFIGLWAIGVPSAGALALINGLAEFVPIIGAWLGAIPALLIASGQDSTTLLLTALLVLAIQQLESNIILPLIMREMTHIPPAVLLLAVLVFGTLFGAAGVVLAAPITIVLATALDVWTRTDAPQPAETPA
jgi:predicted PurR-regulated permease PerM